MPLCSTRLRIIDAIDAEALVRLPFERAFVSSLTYAELRTGLVTASSLEVLRHRSRRIEDIERRFGQGLPFDDTCAREYERIGQLLFDRGQGVRSNVVDRMIASVAIANDLALITSNPSDLRGLEEILEIVGV